MKTTHKALKGRAISPGCSKGAALVSTKPLSFLGGVNYDTSVMIEQDHDLKGKPIKDTVLCDTCALVTWVKT